MSVDFSDEFKAKLAAHVENRPDKQELIHRNIIKAQNVDPALQGVIGNLIKTQTEDRLAHELGRRRSVQELVEKGILYDQSKGTVQIQMAQKTLLRQIERDRLSQFIANRPTLNEIMKTKHHIIEDTMMWTRQVTTGAIPLPRNCHSMTYIQDKQCLYLLGGYGTGARSTELLILDLAQHCWIRPIVAGIIPVERYSHTCSNTGSQLVTFGGFAFNGVWLNDVHVLDTDFVQPFYPKNSRPGPNDQPANMINMMMWYQPEISGTPPSPRAAHSATVVGRRIYIFGGNDGKSLFNDLFILDMEKMSWSQPSMTGFIPTPRAGHTANLVAGNKIVVFGGGNANGPVNDLHVLDIDTMVWTRPPVVGTPPSPRAGHTTTNVFHNQLLVFGGGYLNKVFNDLHLYHFETGTWSRPSDSGTVPIPRAGHSCNVIGSRLYIFGGGDADDVFNDLHILDTAFLRMADDDPAEHPQHSHQHAQHPHHSQPHPHPHPHPHGSPARSHHPHISIPDDVPQRIKFTPEEAELVLNKISQTTDRIQRVLEQTRYHIETKQMEQKRKEEELFALLKLVENSRKSQFEILREEIKSVQSIVMTELQELKESFMIHRKRSMAGDVSDLPFSPHTFPASSPRSTPSSAFSSPSVSQVSSPSLNTLHHSNSSSSIPPLAAIPPTHHKKKSTDTRANTPNPQQQQQNTNSNNNSTNTNNNNSNNHNNNNNSNNTSNQHLSAPHHHHGKSHGEENEYVKVAGKWREMEQASSQQQTSQRPMSYPTPSQARDLLLKRKSSSENDRRAAAAAASASASAAASPQKTHPAHGMPVPSGHVKQASRGWEKLAMNGIVNHTRGPSNSVSSNNSDGSVPTSSNNTNNIPAPITVPPNNANHSNSNSSGTPSTRSPSPSSSPSPSPSPPSSAPASPLPAIPSSPSPSPATGNSNSNTNTNPNPSNKSKRQPSK